MMENARHLSSPSPTSPFLFHHSERSYKSNSLTPLLSSTVDVNSADDCFSASTTNLGHQNHNLFAIDQQHPALVDNSHTSHQRHSDQCVIDQDSLTGVDGDDGMHNMLSGSSTSSNSTIPLLTESHSHHSFSRISLEEYSPLSLVEDCDNALPISPTSIACGSHHSFKSSLNGLKIESLVGDGGLHDHEVHEDINDARSLSPSLLSGSSNHNNLWSNSSTAITQNMALLNSTSATLLLSQHHHQQQINSLMQQLEPQSLDEPPPLITHSVGVDSNLFPSHRPSSEPPPGLEIPKIEIKCSQTKVRPQTSNKGGSVLSAGTAPQQANRTRRNRNRSRTNKSSVLSKVPENSKKIPINAIVATKSIVHDTKLHLQLNHHKKLQELQQRLFGTATRQENEVIDNKNKNGDSEKPTQSSPKRTANKCSKKDEPDSSAESQEDTITQNQTNTTSNGRPTRSRRARKRKNDAPDSASSSQPRVINQPSVTTETAEPDTTTKTAECIKLADLLSNTNSENKNRFIVNGLTNVGDSSDADNGERRVQQIQVQVSPSLTVVTNNGLMQPINIQPQSTSGTLITTTGATYSNQILCRTQNVTTNGQLKSVITNNELLKSVDNWSLTQSNNGNQNGVSGNSTMTNCQPIGTHQIAIQVICQDGTSLVLPVTSTASLNAAVSLTSPHPQLQAILASNANNQQRNANQLVPLMSTANLNSQERAETRPNSSSSQSTQSSNVQVSGLAANSPTLAALLDAGSIRNNVDYNSPIASGQSFASTNLLRKLVSGGCNESKKGDFTFQPSSTVSLANCGPLVTVRTQNTTNSPQTNNINKSNNNPDTNADKRIKIETVEVNNVLACPSIVDTSGLIVLNGNDRAAKQQHNSSSGSNNIASMKAPDSAKQSKVSSNTGNRQVDPTQPFRCEHCNSTFTRLGNFTRHKKIHTVPSKVSWI